MLPVETVQPPYHLFRRGIEADLLPYAQAHHIGVLAYGPLAHGLLGGAITGATTFGPGDWRARSRAFTGDGFARNLQVVTALRAFAARRGATIAQLAVAWVLQNRNVAAAIIGATRPEQVRENVKASGVVLEPGLLKRIDEALAPVIQRDPALTQSPAHRP